MTPPRRLPPLEARWATGQAERGRTPRRVLGTLVGRPDSYDPVARLRWQGERRIGELLPIRYQRMLASPLAHFRGAALVMADDLARGRSSSLEVQICGDAHLSNFGIFSSPERQLVFDVNDFDETDQGPFEWDVKRLVTSLVIASEQLGHYPHVQAAIAFDAAKEYQRSMRRFAQESRLDVWYAALDVETILVQLRGFFADNAMRHVDDVIHRAKSKESSRAFNEMITYTKTGPRISPRPPHVTPLSAMESGTLVARSVVYQVLDGYRTTLSGDRQALLAQFTPVDAAHQVVGVGSVGTADYIVLLVGRDEDDPFFLQVKEAQPSVIAMARGASPAMRHGQRVVSGQKLMQATPDVFLGWHTVRSARYERSFYIRQLYDNRASVIIEQLNESQFRAYGRVCAWVLARAHARSGHGAEIAGYLGSSERFAEAMATFALAYRDQNLADYHALARAGEEGRITVAS